MKKLKKISSEFKAISQDEMLNVCGGRTGEVTNDYCWIIETTDPTDANWNCSDAANTSWIDGVLQGTVVVSEQP